MGFLDKVKGVVGQPNVQDLAGQYAPEVSAKVVEALGPLVDQAGGVIHDDPKYLEYVASPLFRMLPLPLQMLGRERLKWDPIMLDVRDQVVETEGGRIGIRPNAPQIVLAIVQQHFSA